MTLDVLWYHTAFNEKFAYSKCLHYKKVFKKLGIKQKYHGKRWFLNYKKSLCDF